MGRAAWDSDRWSTVIKDDIAKHIHKIIPAINRFVLIRMHILHFKEKSEPFDRPINSVLVHKQVDMKETLIKIFQIE